MPIYCYRASLKFEKIFGTMMISDDKSTDPEEPLEGVELTPEDEEGGEPEKKLEDYTEEELAEMDEFEREALEKDARLRAKWEREARLEVLRNGLKDVKARIVRIMELQKNMGRIPDVDGKAAISLCISALARHNDEKAIRNALNASLNYLKMQKEREDYEISQEEKRKAREEEEKNAPKKKKSFFKKP